MVNLKWLRTSSGLNILFSALAFLVSGVGGWFLLKNVDQASDWRNIAQNLLAAAVIGAFAVLSAVLQYFLVTRNIEWIVQSGIRRVRKRGNPGSGWPKQLRAARLLIFFGKDHSKLIKYQYDLLKVQIQNENVDVHFHLLETKDPYYIAHPAELISRTEAAATLYELL